MGCTYEAEPVDFNCILDIANDFKNGDFGVTPIRKVLKQVDGSLAAIGGAEVFTKEDFSELDDQELADKLIESIPNEGETAASFSGALTSLLMEVACRTICKF